MFSLGLKEKQAILLADITIIGGIMEEDSPMVLTGNFRICIYRKSGQVFVQLGCRPLAAAQDAKDIFVDQKDLMIVA